MVAYANAPGDPLPNTIGPAEIALLSPTAVQVTDGYNWPHWLTSITTPYAIPTLSAVSPAGGLSPAAAPR